MGYRRACIDYQRVPDGEKWGKKLAGWTTWRFSPRNILLSPHDREAACKVALAVGAFAACGATLLACVGADTVTFGGVTVPCVWLNIIICGGHGATSTITDCKVVAG